MHITDQIQNPMNIPGFGFLLDEQILISIVQYCILTIIETYELPAKIWSLCSAICE